MTDLSADLKKSEERIARAKRVFIVRSMTGLTRKQFGDAIGVSDSAIKVWEEGKGGGLTEKGAHKISQGVTQLKIECSPLWLLHGIGSWPIFLQREISNIVPAYTNNIAETNLDEATTIKKEVDYFCLLNPNAIVIKLGDDNLLPFLGKEDTVGGFWLSSINNNAIDSFCIFQSKQHQYICGKLAGIIKDSLVSIEFPNIKTTKNIEIVKIAPIIYFRRLQQFN